MPRSKFELVRMAPQAEAPQAASAEPQEQLAGWVDDHADALFRFAILRVKDQHTVEDLLQETYLAALGSSPTFRGDSSTRTWLIAILRLKIIDYYRRTSKELGNPQASNPPIGCLDRAKRLKKWNCDPSQTLENLEFWEVFRNCVDKLPGTLSRAFALRELDGCSPNQVSELLSITHENLAVRVYRARTMLRDCLDNHWFSKD